MTVAVVASDGNVLEARAMPIAQWLTPTEIEFEREEAYEFLIGPSTH